MRVNDAEIGLKLRKPWGAGQRNARTGRSHRSGVALADLVARGACKALYTLNYHVVK